MVHATSDLRELCVEWPLVWMLDLPDEANIVVAGAYHGRVMALLATMYPDYAYMAGFEPQPEACAAARARINPYPAMYVYPYGLAEQDGRFMMGQYGSVYAGFRNLTEPFGQGEVREAVETFNSLRLLPIDLLFLNMEGYEFVLLPHLVDRGLFADGSIRRLAMQTHYGLPGNTTVEYRLLNAIMEIERTHRREYDTLPQWGYWRYQGD